MHMLYTDSVTPDQHTHPHNRTTWSADKSLKPFIYISGQSRSQIKLCGYAADQMLNCQHVSFYSVVKDPEYLSRLQYLILHVTCRLYEITSGSHLDSYPSNYLHYLHHFTGEYKAFKKYLRCMNCT